MRMGLCLALLVCAALVSDSDAGPVWEAIKELAKEVVKWVQKNCSIGTVGPSCDIGRKRALGEALLPHQQRALDNVCAGFEGVNTRGLPFDAVKDIFEEVDGGTAGDDVLDETEFAQFMEAVALFESCISN